MITHKPSGARVPWGFQGARSLKDAKAYVEHMAEHVGNVGSGTEFGMHPTREELDHMNEVHQAHLDPDLLPDLKEKIKNRKENADRDAAVEQATAEASAEDTGGNADESAVDADPADPETSIESMSHDDMREMVEEHAVNLAKDSEINPKDAVFKVMVYPSIHASSDGSYPGTMTGEDPVDLDQAMEDPNLFQPGRIWDVFVYSKSGGGDPWLVDTASLTIRPPQMTASSKQAISRMKETISSVDDNALKGMIAELKRKLETPNQDGPTKAFHRARLSLYAEEYKKRAAAEREKHEPKIQEFIAKAKEAIADGDPDSARFFANQARRISGEGRDDIDSIRHRATGMTRAAKAARRLKQLRAEEAEAVARAAQIAPAPPRRTSAPNSAHPSWEAQGHKFTGPRTTIDHDTFVQRSADPGKPWLRLVRQSEGSTQYHVSVHKTKGEAMSGPTGFDPAHHTRAEDRAVGRDEVSPIASTRYTGWKKEGGRWTQGEHYHGRDLKRDDSLWSGGRDRASYFPMGHDPNTAIPKNETKGMRERREAHERTVKSGTISAYVNDEVSSFAAGLSSLGHAALGKQIRALREQVGERVNQGVTSTTVSHPRLGSHQFLREDSHLRMQKLKLEELLDERTSRTGRVAAERQEPRLPPVMPGDQSNGGAPEGHHHIARGGSDRSTVKSSPRSVGHWGVHKETQGKWVVTHKPSGLSLGTYTSSKEAGMFAQHMHNQLGEARSAATFGSAPGGQDGEREMAAMKEAHDDFHARHGTNHADGGVISIPSVQAARKPRKARKAVDAASIGAIVPEDLEGETEDMEKSRMRIPRRAKRQVPLRAAVRNGRVIIGVAQARLERRPQR